ncbi:MAG TPA: amidohydrolase [Azospirillaceae bacterium]|nr:amidohydrolase [Azospirillaceae bacterium]
MRGALLGALIVVQSALIPLATKDARAETATLYRNAKVLTVDQGFRTAEAFAVRGDTILAVGTEAEVSEKAGSDAKVQDLGGRTVIPGLIDNHVHMLRAAATWADEVRLDGADTVEEALARIREKAAKTPKGQWIYTLGGFTEGQFENGPHWFSRSELDAAAPDHPVYLQHMFSHAYVNSAAARVAGLTGATAKALARTGEMPAGPDGLPLGPVAGRAMSQVRAWVPGPNADKARAGALAITHEFAAAGLTAVFDMGGFGIRDQDYPPFAALAEENRLPIRVFHTRWFRNDDGPRGREAFERETSGLKVFSGPPFFRLIGAGELLHMPMMDSTDQPGSGDPADLARFEQILRTLAKAGWPVRIHTESDVTISRHLDIIERMVASGIPVAPLRWTIEHADGISDRSLRRMKALGMMAALHSRPLVFGTRHHQAIGDRAYGLPPLRRVQDSGVPWGLGSDSLMANVFNPFHTLWWAVTGKALDGKQVTRPTLTREEALIAHTRSNAYLLFAEREIGSIEPGKFADFVVLSDDYMTIPVDGIRDLRAVMTVVAGKVVHDAR